MKLFVWLRLEGIYPRSHGNAGLVVYAESLEFARHDATVTIRSVYTDSAESIYKFAERDERAWLASDPDFVFEANLLDGTIPEPDISDDTIVREQGGSTVFIFPDAGCC